MADIDGFEQAGKLWFSCKTEAENHCIIALSPEEGSSEDAGLPGWEIKFGYKGKSCDIKRGKVGDKVVKYD